tara:strand:- start:6407 stop:7018 length:612 start_codon:yes stop_codon:yes gene_type:complete
MFKDHQPIIQKWAEKSPTNTMKVIWFVSATIQQHFSTADKIYNSFLKEGIESKYAWGSKADTLTYSAKNKKKLYEDIHDPNMPLEIKLLNVASIPGIGLPKAGFVLQLCVGEVGCLDSHNLRRFGLSPHTFKLSKKLKYDTALRKAELYLKTCEELGGCEYLWDSWCEFLADLYPKSFQDVEQVSTFHVKCILPISTFRSIAK